jgi:hypothetical protein
MKPLRFLAPGLALLTFLFLTGCSTTESTRAKALRTSTPPTDLSRYQTATVVPFDVTAGREVDPIVANRLADDIASRLRHDFGSLF